MRGSAYPRATVHSPLARWREMGWGRRLDIQRLTPSPSPSPSPSPPGQGERELNAYPHYSVAQPASIPSLARLLCGWPAHAAQKPVCWGIMPRYLYAVSAAQGSPVGATSHVNHSSPSPAGGRGISLGFPLVLRSASANRRHNPRSRTDSRHSQHPRICPRPGVWLEDWQTELPIGENP